MEIGESSHQRPQACWSEINATAVALFVQEPEFDFVVTEVH
ncbi:MAG: hypothetical protein BWY72_02308 [Bacteroidetes bacterium ADurb.Bin416]|nr:MAG: hypothetical protein BWY72_02308 [Bacteroidetes bacterium ADurb.Bin416]